MTLEPSVLAYLAERMRRADTILFTGAGFSRGATNLIGDAIPIGQELAKLIWALCYPREPYDGVSKLEDLFGVASSRNPKGLSDVLQRTLRLQPDSIPEYYAKLLSLPWYRAYTLNVDDFSAAICRKFALPRRLNSLSAIRWANRPTPEATAVSLDVVHLNGVLDDAPEGVTFSPAQYAERLAGQEPLYALCAADVLSRPVVYIGTPLDESPLWQHVHMRRRGPRTKREFRRQSFIITPTLDRAPRELLEREFHVTHLPMTVEEFATELLPEVASASEEGYALLRASAEARMSLTRVPIAGELAASAGEGSADYLLGRSPDWGDVRDGISSERGCDAEILQLALDFLALKNESRNVVLVTGTAGAGKSTVVMRLALALSANGVNVGWVDSSIDISPLDLRRSMEEKDAPRVLIIDDAERYGSQLPSMLREFQPRSAPPPLVIVTIRSGRGADRFADGADAQALSFTEFLLPNLTDSDILALLATLDLHKRLGVLKGKSRNEQVASFREFASRQIIVALLQATSGRRFEELLVSELTELRDDAKMLYAIAAVGSALRFGLTRDELLLSVGDASNATLASIDALQREKLLVLDRSGEIRVRHRVIADVLMHHLAAQHELTPIVTGLAVAAATKLTRATSTHHRFARRMRSLMNHDWLVEQVGVRDAREVYEELELLLDWNYHYWLQRGSFELEHGDLNLAENFLNQAYSLAPDDPLVITEYAYLQLRLAITDSASADSRRLLRKGLDLLSDAIIARRQSDPHQYHIYGRQGLEWLRPGDVTAQEREDLLREITSKVEEGRKAHARNEPLRELFVDITTEKLGVAFH
jgi:Mrp family chromosome partitioning ATPase/tetratricopeptide (TPR) repeat protein